ncbi:MAG: HEAT repeat domain-containing protein, partial [Candidatus Competibacteraceae bacterium]|nr:HEAT repeat domain-containing protein [Candidatus Competibacteraceae bacterium]
LELEARLLPLLAHDGDPRVRIAAFHALATALRELPANGQALPVAATTLRYLYGAALDQRQVAWIQTEALELLEALDLPSLATVLNARLTRPGAGDDLFIRRRAVRLLGRNLKALPDLTPLLATVEHDPSPYVRQGLAEALPSLPLAAALPVWVRLSRQDDAPPVRAAALLQIGALLRVAPELAAPLQDGLAAVLATETDAFVLRVALREVGRVHQQWLEAAAQESPARAWRDALGPAVARLHERADRIAVRRWAAQTYEQLWAWATPERRRRLQALAEQIARIPAGGSRRLPRKLAQDDADLGRLLALLAQDDHGYDLRRNGFGAWLRRGQSLGFRAWRWLYEFRHPATDKRQAFRHTVGRIYQGNLRAPSAILAELAETKVPGEPLFDSDEAGWRPYLPLVDELISCLDQWHRTLRRYTSEGVTEIVAPRPLWRRLWARTVLTLRFAEYARLRNWREGAQQNPATYLQAIARLGFTCRLLPHPMESGLLLEPDPLVQRFFPMPSSPAPLPPAGEGSAWLRLGQGLVLWPKGNWEGLWERFREYFFSVYQNSLFDLGVFLAVVGGLFFGQHVYVNQRIRQARRRRALVMGGWGTRGKSGTERLKAALINALGFGMVSKTTGCEAMFLHAYPFGSLKEMFLFRPYDKATIWEQGDVLRLADRLNAEVFLWECMGLTPAYVRILQRQWMRDDLATITNTYPDHEDIQGPAGYNIPEVMTEFIPANSLLLTSEEQMLPILRDAARPLNTCVKTVGWLEAGLLTEDVLARFPYEEHPYNIALTLALARELDVDRDFALKEMADRVVADIGVLKRYPQAQVRDRQLAFINGMSANERFGCLNNWERMGFDRQDRDQEPEVWISTVVNNRADRIPRSRVFAGILVADLSADRHFLIGGNLDGLQGYIREAWDRHIQNISLWPADAKQASALQVLEKQACWLRIPTQARQVRQRLFALLNRLGIADPPHPAPEFWRDPPGLERWLAALEVAEEHRSALAAHLAEEGQCFDEYQTLKEQVSRGASAQRAALNQAFHEQLWRWFARKFIVIRDPHASGEQIIARIVNETPPGMTHRLMGMQNIKGPGLDFVYRWQAWETCHQACRHLCDADPLLVRRGLQELAAFQEFGLLSEGEAREALVQVRSR